MTATISRLGRRRGVAAYASLVAGVFGLAVLAVHAGSGHSGQSRTHVGTTGAGPAGGVATWHLLAAIGAIVLLCRAGGWLARRAGQPEVVGEIVAGVLLGPSLLGAAAPGAVEGLLPAPLRAQLGAFANVGVALFVFGLGVELDWSMLRRRSHAALWVSHASIAVPFVGGCFLALTLGGKLGPQGSFAPFCLFLGVAMSITAFPVLGRILEETGWIRTRVGQLSVVCAAVDDVTAWLVLSLVVAIARSGGWGTTLQTTLLAAALATLMLGPVRRLLAAVAGRPAVASAAVAGSVGLLAAGASDWIGLHAIFGAFLAGCAIPRAGPLYEHARRLSPLTSGLLLPLFFVVSGLQVDLRGLVHHSGELVAGLAILGVAVAGKVGGAAVAGRWTGLPKSEALVLGVLLNCRGLTELIVLGVGLQLGVLSRSLYTVLVLMALTTTAMTTPLLRLVAPSPRAEVPNSPP